MPQTAEAMIKPGCVMCEFVLYRLREWMQDEHTQDAINNGLIKVCAEAPASIRDQCTNLVGIYAPAIEQLIIQGADPEEVCTILHLCTDNLEEVEQEQELSLAAAAVQESNSIAQLKEKDSNCATCQYVVAVVLDGIKNKDNQDEIRNVLDKVCTLLPESASLKCEQVVNAYAETLIDLIAQNLTPDEICAGIGLCKQPPPKTKTCIICKYVVQTVDHVLEDKTNVDKIIQAMDKACVVLYEPKLKKECREFIETYTPAIADLIATGATPEQVCSLVGLCSAQVDDVPVLPQVDNQQQSDVSESGTCSVCEFLVQELDSALDDPSDVEEVKQFLESACVYMPTEAMKANCKTFVDTYTASILDLIAHGASPKEVCQELGLCDAGMIMGPVPESFEEDDSSEEEEESIEEEAELEDHPFCLLCEYAISEVDSVIEDKHNEAEVRQALEQVCYKLSKPLTRDCLSFVDQYIDKIIYMITNDYTPEKVCTSINMCEKKNPVVAQPRPSLQRSNANDISRFDNSINQVGNGAMCTICEFGMNIVEKQIITNRTLDMAERAVLMMCSYLPGKFEDECEGFVEQYGDAIIDLIIEAELSPEQVCSELGLCSAARSWDASLVGGNLCNFGPAFWCQSKFHMKQCGTASFCSTRFGRKYFN